jgi:hypothetical protein
MQHLHGLFIWYTCWLLQRGYAQDFFGWHGRIDCVQRAWRINGDVERRLSVTITLVDVRPAGNQKRADLFVPLERS